MKHSKFSLADDLTLLAALSFGYVCFLGANFFTLGNTKQSIILAVIIAVLLEGLAFGVKLLKRTSRNFKSCFIWEIVLLAAFVGLAFIFANSPFPHYFTVSGKKAEIQSKLLASITQAENMFDEYESYAENRKSIYKSKLRSVAAAKNVNPKEYAKCFENNGVADETQIENKIFAVNANLFPSNYEAMQEVDSKWLADARRTVESWKPIGIVAVVNEVEKNSKKWLGELQSFSSVRGKDEQAEDFAYPLSFDDVKTAFTTLGKPTPLTIGLAALAYVLMLLSWFFSERDTKSSYSFRDLFSKKRKDKGKYDVNQ
ncbi:MAG: hypothetical protein LBD80_02965 [Tannerella sp.]|jgi:hypothetical protein|nr:hypothetical protein [Tannerella sp.]